MKSMNKIIQLAVLVTALLGATIAWGVQATTSYQGRLTDTSGNVINNTGATIVFRIWDDPLHQLPSFEPLWEETHYPVIVENGIINVTLGQTVALPSGSEVASHDLWLEIEYEGEVMNPRLAVGSVFGALYAEKAGDAESVGGRQLVELALQDDLTTHTVNAAAHHTKTSSFTELSGQIADGQVPASIARDAEITWANLGGIPAGFADGVDNVGISSESDPQVGTNVTNYLPRWNGSALVQGTIYDSNGLIGIGNDNPSTKLDVLGTTSIKPGNYYYLKGDTLPSNVQYRCDCDISGTTADCGPFFYSDAGSLAECFDWWSDAGQPMSDRYLRQSSAPVAFHVGPGGVGIGTVNPSAKLEVMNSLKISGSDPHLIIRDTNGGGERPGLRFLNNTVATFETEDKGNSVFAFYSGFSYYRNYDSVIAAYGKAPSGSWGKYTAITHDGTDGEVKTDSGDLKLSPAGGDVNVSGNVKITTNGSGVIFPDGSQQKTAVLLPPPLYDSGWVNYTGGGANAMVLTHNVGGNVDNYVIDLTFKNTGGRHNKALGGDWGPVGDGHAQDGVYWKELTTSTIALRGGNYDLSVEQVRVRIWSY